jgi:hypothetical protein
MGVLVGILSLLGLRLKTVDHLGLDDGGVSRRYAHGGVVVEPRYPSVTFDIFGDLLCNRVHRRLM